MSNLVEPCVASDTIVRACLLLLQPAMQPLESYACHSMTVNNDP